MWTFAIPATCVLAHLYLVVMFLPGLWREIDQRGVRWRYAFTYYLVPLVSAVLIISHVVTNLATLPTWLLVVSFITVDALILAAVLAAVGLRARRRRAA